MKELTMADTLLNQPFLTTYIMVTGFLLAAGVFFDRLAGDPLKQQIAGFLRDRLSFQMDLTEYTKFFVSGSITRFFHGDIITTRNFVKSLAVALSSLTVVISMYAIKNQQNPLEFLNVVDSDNLYLNIFGLIIIFSAVLIGEIFSILQTALLLNLVGSIRSANDVLFLLFCDLIITINIFVFALPIGLQWATVANDIYGVEVIWNIELPQAGDKEDEDLGDQKLTKLARDPSFHGRTLWSLASNTASASHTVPSAVPVVFKNYDPVQAVKDIASRVGSQPRESNKLAKLPSDDPMMDVFLERKYATADVHLGNMLTFRGMANTYGLMFIQSRIVQNVFPMIATLQPVMLRLEGTYPAESGFTKIPHRDARRYYVRCDAMEFFADDIPDLGGCSQAVVASVGQSLESAYTWVGRAKPFIKEIPVAPLAFSCLFLTFSFYALMILSYLMIRIASVMHFVTFTQRYVDIDKSTFLAIAAFSCVFLVPVFLVCFIFYTLVLT